MCSPPPSAEVKNEWNHPSVRPICLRGVERESFTFTCTRIHYVKIHETDREIGMRQMNSLHSACYTFKNTSTGNLNVFVENRVDWP
jgi:hypothetical protein